jgi:RimJ/RimL family protein N-acetyltransferase
MDLDRTTLEGEYLRLEPLSKEAHLDALQAAGSDATTVRWFRTQLSTADHMREWVEDAIDAREQGTALPFVHVHQESERIIGSTRFGNIAPVDDRVEIGWTWLTPAHQRTPANTEAKFLMLRHAFETWDCRRVEFKTDTRNQRSRNALERIGATEEGVLRQHMNTHTGIRDTVYFSILDTEWPAIKRELHDKLRN